MRMPMMMARNWPSILSSFGPATHAGFGVLPRGIRHLEIGSVIIIIMQSASFSSGPMMVGVVVGVKITPAVLIDDIGHVCLE
jgi:hypothetical protein